MYKPDKVAWIYGTLIGATLTTIMCLVMGSSLHAVIAGWLTGVGTMAAVYNVLAFRYRRSLNA